MKHYRGAPVIKAMTFDLDDTLYDNWPVIMRLEKGLDAWFEEHHPVYHQKEASWWKNVKHQSALDNKGLSHDVSAWRHFYLKLGLTKLGYSEEQAKQAADDAMVEVTKWRNDFEVPAQTHQVMRLLQKKYPLVAITNGNVDPVKIGLASYFSCVLKAGPDGAAKPEPELFKKAEQHLGISAQHILHVGDHLVSDVQGAVESGFQACWINNTSLGLRQQKGTTLPHIEIADLSELLDL